MSCMCGGEFCGEGLGALGAIGLPEQSRVVYSGDTYTGYFTSDNVAASFKQNLQRRGLQVEDVTYNHKSTSVGGQGFIYTYYATVITPIDRANVNDLTWDMSQDLKKASGSDVFNDSISVLIYGQKDESGNTIYTQLPGAPTPPGQGKSIWQGIAEMFDVGLDEAKMIGVGAVAVLAILLVRR